MTDGMIRLLVNDDPDTIFAYLLDSQRRAGAKPHWLTPVSKEYRLVRVEDGKRLGCLHIRMDKNWADVAWFDAPRILAKNGYRIIEHEGEHYVCLPIQAEENDVSLRGDEMLSDEELNNRFGFHKATIEGPEATQPKHAALRRAFLEWATALNGEIPGGRYKSLMWTAFEEASMWAHKAIAQTAPLEDAGSGSANAFNALTGENRPEHSYLTAAEFLGKTDSKMTKDEARRVFSNENTDSPTQEPNTREEESLAAQQEIDRLRDEEEFHRHGQ
jgi:hypothetical protein